MTIYQLRRLHVNQDPRSTLPDDTVLLFQTTKIGRNPDLVDVVLISSVHSNMISREHTTIFVRAKRERYICTIKDHSLNGTYVNDFRVLGETELQQGDVIKFGHVNGAAIKPGCHGPQTSAEFTFVFEEAPPHRLGDRRRPLTIFGSSRSQESLPFPSQMFVGEKSLHPTSRIHLANPSMEFAASWQNPAAASAAAAAAPFYNLQKFPGYYQAAFPQLSPAYLQSLWPQNPWPSASPTAAHQLQQQQLQHQKQQAHAAAQYGQLNPAWMGASAQIAADTASLIGAAGDNRLRAVTSEETLSPRLASTGAAQAATVTTCATTTVTCPQRPDTANAAVNVHQSSVIGQGISMQSRESLHSFTHRTPVASSSTAPTRTSNGRSSGIATGTGDLVSVVTGQQQQLLRSRTSVETQRISRLAECSPAQVIATPSAVDSVKRMECDSSVPSPPKGQHQQQGTGAMFGAVPAGAVGIHRMVSTTTSQPAVASVEVPAQVEVQTPASLLLATASAERRFRNDRIATPIDTSSTFTLSTSEPSALANSDDAAAALRTVPPGTVAHTAVSQIPVSLVIASTSALSEEAPMENLRKENAEQNSQMSGLEELTDDLLEDCGPPKRAVSPATTSVEMTATAVTLQNSPSSKNIEVQQKNKSPAHQSPKRRGHGHSDSSRSPSRTPVVVEKKAETKKRRKNNEVAMLLNDLTEVAWHHLARKSTNKITAPTQTRKVYTPEDDESSECESIDSIKSARKKRQQKITKQKKMSTKNVTFSKSIESGKASRRKRGRPKKSCLPSDCVNSTSTVKKKLLMKKKRKDSSNSSSSSRSICSSSHSGSDQESRKEDVEKSVVLKNQQGTSAAEKIERALDMMNRRKFPHSDDESSTSSFSTSSSPSPIRRTWGASSQRKTGSVPGSSGLGKKKSTNVDRQSRSVNKIPRKLPRKGVSVSSANSAKKGRRKKNQSSSSESESTSESSNVEWETMKPVVTPLPAAKAPLVFDEWTYHDPEKQCDARSGCKKPQSENVDWVQCDYCNRWYHIECVADRGVTVDNADDFECGCRDSSKTS